jgi:hypothetical protein
MTPDPPGPPQPGSRIHEVLKLAGRRFTTERRRPRRPHVMPNPGGDGSVFTYTIELEPKGSPRALGPLLLPLLRSGLQKDLKRHKALLEVA